MSKPSGQEALRKLIKTLGLLGVFAIVGVGIWIAASGSGSATADSGTMANVMCEQFAEKRLVSPASAAWPHSRMANIEKIAGGKYRVRTYVDSQNAYGALVRSRVDCTLQFRGGDEWALESITIE